MAGRDYEETAAVATEGLFSAIEDIGAAMRAEREARLGRARDLLRQHRESLPPGWEMRIDDSLHLTPRGFIEGNGEGFHVSLDSPEAAFRAAVDWLRDEAGWMAMPALIGRTVGAWAAPIVYHIWRHRDDLHPAILALAATGKQGLRALGKAYLNGETHLTPQQILALADFCARRDA